MLPRSRKSHLLYTHPEKKPTCLESSLSVWQPCLAALFWFVFSRVFQAEYKTELERLRVELERLSPNLKAVDQLQGVAEHVQAGPAGGTFGGGGCHEFLSWHTRCDSWYPK